MFRRNKWSYLLLVVAMLAMLLGNSFPVSAQDETPPYPTPARPPSFIPARVPLPDFDPQDLITDEMRERMARERSSDRPPESVPPADTPARHRTDGPPVGPRSGTPLSIRNYVDNHYQEGIGQSYYATVKEYSAAPTGIYARSAPWWRLHGMVETDQYVYDYTYTVEQGTDLLIEYQSFEADADWDWNEPAIQLNVGYLSGYPEWLLIWVYAHTYDNFSNLYFGKDNVQATFTQYPGTSWWYRFYWATDRLPAYRYSTRHVGKLAENYYETRDAVRSARLHDLRSAYGFDKDIYDPLWSKSNSYPDTFWFEDATWRDIDVWDQLPRGYYYYPYKSNVHYSRLLFLEVWKDDPNYWFLFGLHAANKYNDPYVSIYTPKGYAQLKTYLIGMAYEWGGWNGKGIKGGVAYFMKGYSTYRAATYLAMLSRAYKLMLDYGDPTAPDFLARAQEVKNVLEQLQNTTGWVNSADYGTRLRNDHKYGFLTTYDDQFRYIFQRDGIWQKLGWQEANPKEYNGMIPSNAEATIVAYQGLALYYQYCEGITLP